MFKIRKIPLIILIISIIWLSLLFITPASLEPGTVKYLDGNANQIDYWEKWNKLPFPHKMIYAFGDLNCHQKFNRSLIINDNQMPVCSRDFGIFLGCNFGIFFIFFVNTRLSPTRVFLNLFLSQEKIDSIKHRKILVGSILIISAFPLILDGTMQGLTDYESTNTIRIITGFVFGIMYSYGTMALIMSIADS